MKNWILWIGFILLASSCSEKKSPHRPLTTPFASISFESDDISRLSILRFEYDGESVWLEGSAEKDQTASEIRLKGTYRTTQDLLPGVQLALQIYDETGRLLVRDLPRIPFFLDSEGSRVANLNQVYRPIDWGIDFEIENVVVQFNYIQEGEFWYDIQYPEIELPSLKIEKINAPERFDIRWSPIPRIVPRGSYTYLPSLFLARKAHEGEFFHHCSIETFSVPDNARQEHSRNAVESSFSLGEGRFLAFNEFQLQNTGVYLVRPGFVWDGVQWFEVYREDNLKQVLVIPATYYLLGMVLAFVFLGYSWCQMGRTTIPFLRRLVRSLIFLAVVVLAGSAGTSVYGLVLFGLAMGLWIATRHWSWEIRLYLTVLLMLTVLECCWSYLYGNNGVRLSGFLLSMVAYAILLFPIAWVKNRTFAIMAVSLITVLAFSNYLLLDLYFDFFKDYPSLRVLGYASQVSNLTDSILCLLDDSHAVSLVIVVWYTLCAVVCFKKFSGKI